MPTDRQPEVTQEGPYFYVEFNLVQVGKLSDKHRAEIFWDGTVQADWRFRPTDSGSNSSNATAPLIEIKQINAVQEIVIKPLDQKLIEAANEAVIAAQQAQAAIGAVVVLVEEDDTTFTLATGAGVRVTDEPEGQLYPSFIIEF
ncbi:hypothetical protein [Tellurirhabdus bombi]|uniref:hypothetical protein n=1 Tax=Tellurirhabdus bombi TaxID=2907205 RepID=UPI001F3AF3A1|nr:hypothetical protein [Tellurirhabdus bombi]